MKLVREKTARDRLYEDAPSDTHFEIVGDKLAILERFCYCQAVAQSLASYLFPYVREHRLGQVLLYMTYALPSRGNDRQAEVSFVSYQRWAKNRPVLDVNAWPVVPDLVAEAVGPNDKLFDVMDKVEEYFANGVKLVWLILSNVERVYVLTSPTQWTVLNRTDELTGGDVVPGFKLPLVELFPEYPQEAAP